MGDFQDTEGGSNSNSQEVLEGPCSMVVQGGPAEYFMVVMGLLEMFFSQLSSWNRSQ